MAIIRGVTPGEAEAIGEAIFEAGHPDHRGAAQLAGSAGQHRAAGAALRRSALIGAGTVLDPADVARVREAGGRIIVSPNTFAAGDRGGGGGGAGVAPRLLHAVRSLRRAARRSDRAEAVPGRGRGSGGGQGAAGGGAAGRAPARRRRHRPRHHAALARGRRRRLRPRLRPLPAGPVGRRRRRRRRGPMSRDSGASRRWTGLNPSFPRTRESRTDSEPDSRFRGNDDSRSAASALAKAASSSTSSHQRPPQCPGEGAARIGERLDALGQRAACRRRRGWRAAPRAAPGRR